MDCPICLNPLTEFPSSLISQDLDTEIIENFKQDTNELSKLCCTPCGHVFHRKCLSSWFESKAKSKDRTCPFCRKKVIQAKLYPIYLAPEEKRFTRELPSPGCQTSGKRKSLISSLRRIFSISSRSTDHGSLQVEVTICVPEGRNEVIAEVGEVASHLHTTEPERTYRACGCPCPHHHAEVS